MPLIRPIRFCRTTTSSSTSRTAHLDRQPAVWRFAKRSAVGACVAALLLILILLAAGCGDSDEGRADGDGDGRGPTTPLVDPTVEVPTAPAVVA